MPDGRLSTHATVCPLLTTRASIQVRLPAGSASLQRWSATLAVCQLGLGRYSLKPRDSDGNSGPRRNAPMARHTNQVALATAGCMWLARRHPLHYQSKNGNMMRVQRRAYVNAHICTYTLTPRIRQTHTRPHTERQGGLETALRQTHTCRERGERRGRERQRELLKRHK